MSRFLLVLSVFLTSPLHAKVEVLAQTGKRWSETKTQVLGSNQSFLFAVHGNFSLTDRVSIVAGPSLVLDHYKGLDKCESSSCHSSSYYKIGVDLGSEFTLPLITVFVHGRALVHSHGRSKVSGKTSLRFPETLKTFEGGNAEGELHSRSVGFNITSGIKWPLLEKLSVMLSLEMAYERSRTENGGLTIRNDKGETLHLGPSLKTDWISNNSSAIYIGLAYTI